MRIVVDLQACQTESSRARGVGRYSRAIAAHMATLCGDDDLRFCLNGLYPDGRAEMMETLGWQMRRANLSTYMYPPLERVTPGERSASVRVAESLVRRHWLALQPDVLHLSNVFEQFGGNAVVPQSLPHVPGLLRSATLYDLIPLRFSDQYLADPGFERWYLGKLGVLRQCDHILAISESTRSDAIDLLGIDPDRITTIWSAADSIFRPLPLGNDEIRAFRSRWRLRERFVLYTGGDEYRKNLEGAIAGYAELPCELRRDVQLVLVCAVDSTRRAELRARARQLRLAPDDVVFTGFVAERDLITFYNLCDAFVFPSMYEGFGLPLLEAMQCGAAVLGADNSSIRELIERPDALFDCRQPASLAERLAQVLGNNAFRTELRRFGVERARRFSWQSSASVALDALREAHAQLRPVAPVVAAGILRRKRLALFTPMPPSRSGIADYNAAFLPYLARYFEIDVFVDDDQVSDRYLGANFRIRKHEEFDRSSASYDAVLYDIGNSEFHAYMLEHVQRQPGIVVLHDAFLSGLYGYMEFNRGAVGKLSCEMLAQHGPRARRYLAPAQRARDPVGAAILNLPVTKAILERAIGIISHTPYNLEVARQNYPEQWAAPYRIVKQMVRIPATVDPTSRRNARARIGLGEDDFVVCTFGHVVWTKCGDILLEAFERSALGMDPKAKLVYVGEASKDAFGQSLVAAMERSVVFERVRMTGYVDESDYSDYLRAADLAVQLRTNTRGGTSKAVLDCLVHGLPVIVNDAGSFSDYPDGVVQKIPAEPGADALAAMLERLLARRAELPLLGRQGRDHVVNEHAPERIAAEYALAINEFSRRWEGASAATAIHELGGILADDASATPLLDRTADALHRELTSALFAPQRVLIDVTHIVAGDLATGIQRVVKNIVRWIYCSKRAGFRPLAVRLEAGKLVEASEWLEAQGLNLPVERQFADRVVEIRWGDCLLMLDSSWKWHEEFQPVFERVREAGGEIHTVVYDLLPIRMPHCWPPGAAHWFEDWLRKAIVASDGLICISHAVADDLETYIRTSRIEWTADKRLGFWHLGADFTASNEREQAATKRVERSMSRRTLLMVGTIEPRKNHALALNAMEILWARGTEISLCIAGKQGWLVEDFIERISTHPERGRRLHYLEAPSDAELHECYRRSAGLLFPSAGEGFGLPLIEAAHFDTPIIASDIPVMREIAGEHATYFTPGSATELAGILERWLSDAAEQRVPQSHAINQLTWEQSAERLLDVVLERKWYKVMRRPNSPEVAAAGDLTAAAERDVAMQSRSAR